MDPAAEFWMMKYFELLGHSTKVMTELARPALQQNIQKQADRLRESQGGQGK